MSLSAVKSAGKVSVERFLAEFPSTSVKSHSTKNLIIIRKQSLVSRLVNI